MIQLPSPLLVVTDRTLCPIPLDQQVEKLFAAGARWLWFRDKDLGLEERKALAVRLAAIVKRYNGTLSIGGDVALAASIGAQAAHVSTPTDVENARRALGNNALIGMSAHGLPEVAAAKKAGANYVTLSPVFQTSSKPGYGPALGLDAIKLATHHGILIVALGGITINTTGATRHAGANAIAMMGAAMQTPTPELLVRQFFERWTISTIVTLP